MLSEEFSAETNPHTTKVKTVYHQEDAQAPIYNGDISGGVNNTTYERGSSFSDSHNQSTVERVITAGNNVNMPTTIQFYLDPSALAASTQSISNIITSLQQNLESAHAFYRSPQNRDHLVHSMANGEPSSSEATAVASAVLHYTIDSFVAPQGDTGTEGTDKDWEMEDTTQPSGSPDNQPGPTDVNITPFDDLDLTSIRSRARTNAEVYTRLMLSCVEGLPCWRPKPSPGTKGIIPGDVGTFDLAHGFRKLFNIWEREQGSQGRPFEAPPSAAVHLSSNHFPRGHAIANGASSSIRRSPDGQSVEQFEFDCISEQGAVLACTSSADLVELENLVSLKQYLNQNAGAIYQQAYLTEQFDSDSLYVVTGCIKTAGWGLAAYQGITSNQTMRLAQRPGGNSSPEDGKLYDWVRAVGEAWLWPNTAGEGNFEEEKAHTLFLRGFTLDFSPAFYTRLISELRTTSMGQGDNRGYYQNISGPQGNGSSGSGGTSSRTFTANLSSTSNRNTTLQAASGVTLTSFPDTSRVATVHPSRLITRLLLELTGADCALSHDDDWRSTFKSSGSPSNPWNDALPLTIIASQTITVSNGVAHFEREIGNLDGFRNASAPSLGTETAEPVNEREEGRDSQLRDRQASGGEGRAFEPDPRARNPPAPSSTSEGVSRRFEASDKKVLPRNEAPKRRASIPADQLEVLEHTKQRVARAVCSVLGPTSDVGYELIYAVTELFDLVPISELAPAAKTLLAIWDAVQNIEVNFYRCLRLTERCADLLISIRDEVHEAGDTVGQESAAPIGKLEDTFQGVLQFMQKQVQRPFLKRYLNRNEIQRDLDVCDEGLRDALSLFSLSIQIRILKQVQEPEKHRREETQALINAMVTGGTIQTSDVPRSPLQPIMGEQTGTDTTRSLSPISLDHKESMDSVQLFITTSNDLGLSDENTTSTASANGIIPLLAGLQQNQNSLDTTKDFTEIRLLMRRAIQAKTDVEMLEILQVKDEQAPEAIKTLQRALEKVASKSGSQEDALPPGLVIGKVTRSVSQKKADGKKSLQRSRTVISIESSTSSIASTAGSTASASATGSGSGRRNSGSRKRDTLNQEFIEAGISALMRMSQGRDTNLPSWTITKFEVDRTQQIGTGRFSKVYRGTWRSRTVAIKVVETEIAAKHFIRAVRIWKQLHHPNVLELYGASSGIGRPWFFVTPYMKRGNLVEYLRKVEIDLHQREDDRRSAEDERFEVRKQWDLFRFMLEIAQGMEYLHSRKVLHGDLKASKVLVDDRYHCVITDFGQREIESEAYELSGESPLRQGTMRWQAPEILTGEVEMTKETDVYAFSIVCAEIVNMGKLPLGTMFEDVSRKDARPTLNPSRFNTPNLQEILELCWHRDPNHRPHFYQIVRDFQILRKSLRAGNETPKGTLLGGTLSSRGGDSPSPDTRPNFTPPLAQITLSRIDFHQGHTRRHQGGTNRQSWADTIELSMPEPVMFTSNRSVHSVLGHEDGIAEGFDLLDLASDTTSLAPTDERVLERKNELRYRLLLDHPFHPSLVLPLWQPSLVQMGAVGYLKKPEGEFITLFNALSPVRSNNSAVASLPSIYAYGKADLRNQKQDKVNIIQKGLDTFVGFIGRSKNPATIPIRRRYSYELRAGQKAAHLCTESTEYVYMVTLNAARKWFQNNIDSIVRTFGQEHRIQREDIVLVTGLLRAPNYALFVSHSHPDGHAHFNVYASPKPGQPWGTFSTESESRHEPGPSYEETDDRWARVEASKVSNHGGPWNTVLLARLRFKPDSDEPTAR